MRGSRSFPSKLPFLAQVVSPFTTRVSCGDTWRCKQEPLKIKVCTISLRLQCIRGHQPPGPYYIHTYLISLTNAVLYLKFTSYQKDKRASPGSPQSICVSLYRSLHSPLFSIVLFSSSWSVIHLTVPFLMPHFKIEHWNICSKARAKFCFRSVC